MRACKRGFVRIRIYGIKGFSGFCQRARLRLAGVCRYSDWWDFGVCGKAQGQRDGILKILILTKKRGQRNPLDSRFRGNDGRKRWNMDKRLTV